MYFPNTEEEFTKTIIQNNRYEWLNISNDYLFRRKTGKMIFVRDIYKQWYIKGINSELNTIEKTADKLKNETEGYKIITVGSSAGGFAAVLFGILLNAEKIFSFSGQFSLSLILNETETPFLFSEKSNIQKNKYFDLPVLLKNSSSPVYYFFPYYNKDDYTQAQQVCNISTVFSFRIDAAEHGRTVLPETHKYLFFAKRKTINKLYKKINHKTITSENFLCMVSMKYTLYYLDIKLKTFIKLLLPEKFVLWLKNKTRRIK